MNTEIKFSDIKLIYVPGSVRRADISDSEYFGKKYKDYISNSRLKLINPDQNGSPKQYLRGFDSNSYSQALSIGSSVHQRVLQNEEFEIAPDLGKPTAKLGATIDRIIKLRKAGQSIDKSIRQACKDCNYYVNQIDRQIPNIIQKGFRYYWLHKQYEDERYIHLSARDRITVESCIESCKRNRKLQMLLKPTDIFGDLKGKSYNEDTFFMNMVCVYGEHSVVLKLKLKADNWTIDTDSKELVLNDLKTTGHPVQGFMDKGHSFQNFHYSRQMAMYSAVLIQFCKENFGFNKKDWSFKANMLCVQTIPPYDTEVFNVSNDLLKQGKEEYEKLLKIVGWYTMFGFDKNVKFV